MLPIDPVGNDSDEKIKQANTAIENRSLLDSSEEESQEVVSATDENLSMTQLIGDPTTTTTSDIDSTTSPQPLEVTSTQDQDMDMGLTHSIDDINM